MIITKLVLHRYKRFSLSNIKTLVYTPVKDLQLILATNGGGKSSLVKELSPLPADLKKDYGENGYKEITILHQDKTYVISSGVAGKNKHSFTVEGTELNVSGIRKIQLQLVEEHFGITPGIHEVVLGNAAFTHMSVSDRKKWLTMLSNIDYTYSIGVFNKLKMRHRDIMGAMKITQNKLLQSDAQQLTDKEIDKSRVDLIMLNKLLTHLIASKSNNIYVSKRNVSEELKDIYREVNKVMKYIDPAINTKANIDGAISAKETELTMLNDKNTKIKTELDAILQIVKNTQGTPDIKILLAKKEELVNKLTALYKLNIPGFDITNISNLNAVYKYAYTDFISILNDLHDHNDIYYTPTIHAQVTHQIDKVTMEIKLLQSKLDIAITELKVQEKHKNSKTITCVNCSHQWHLNFNQQLFDKLTNDVDMLDKQLTTLKHKQTSLLKESESYTSKKDIIVKIKYIINNNKDITQVLKYIIGDNNIQRDTSIIISNANEMSILLDRLSQIPLLGESLNKIEQKIAVIDSNNKILTQVNLSKKEELEKQLSRTIIDKQTLTNTINKLKAHKSATDSLQGYFDQIKTLMKDKNKEHKYLINKLRNDILNDVISDIKYNISSIEKTIHNSDIIKDRANMAKKELEEYSTTERVLKAAIKELSPTEGLIAKSINSFLNMFIGEINTIINSVWNYDIRLLQCEVTSDNDLDYKFPVMIDNNETIMDISMGSSSMKEIINLAFKIVFMKYMGLIGFPLVLDEFAITLDVNHRVKAFDAIDNLIAPNFSQVFIISHFKSMYGRFERGADINILNSDNLELDDTLMYNECMKIIEF